MQINVYQTNSIYTLISGKHNFRYLNVKMLEYLSYKLYTSYTYKVIYFINLT